MKQEVVTLGRLRHINSATITIARLAATAQSRIGLRPRATLPSPVKACAIASATALPATSRAAESETSVRPILMAVSRPPPSKRDTNTNTTTAAAVLDKAPPASSASTGLQSARPCRDAAGCWGGSLRETIAAMSGTGGSLSECISSTVRAILACHSRHAAHSHRCASTSFGNSMLSPSNTELRICRALSQFILAPLTLQAFAGACRALCADRT